MILFNCDYSEGAHPSILQKLSQTNLEQTPGYGVDTYCKQAAQQIQKACHAPQADVHFLCGGTQTNLTVISACLRPYQCVLSADSGHINVHETGAIEAVGHRICALPTEQGKITAEQISRTCKAHWAESNPEFAAQPKMVYLSFPTEYGTLYSKEELSVIRRVCDEHNLFLFIDGARLGYGLASRENDVTLSDIAAVADVFYIGGTKLGALLGEAVVITNNNLKKDFRYFMKQKGAILAKGRVLGIQFSALFENNLYLQLARHANEMALEIRRVCEAAGFESPYHSPTNQQFFVIPNKVLAKLEENYVFSRIRAVNHNETLVRICTSWATREEDVKQLSLDIQKYAGK